MRRLRKRALNSLEAVSIRTTEWVGTPSSIVVHTLVFLGAISLSLFGFDIDLILLILTTAVSLEAIYLAIFIQMTVNRQGTTIAAVEEDIEDIAEDVEDLEEEAEEDNVVDSEVTKTLKSIEARLGSLQSDLESLKKKGLL